MVPTYELDVADASYDDDDSVSSDEHGSRGTAGTPHISRLVHLPEVEDAADPGEIIGEWVRLTRRLRLFFAVRFRASP